MMRRLSSAGVRFLVVVCFAMAPAAVNGQVDTADLVVSAFADEDVPLAGVSVVVRSPATETPTATISSRASDSPGISWAPATC